MCAGGLTSTSVHRRHRDASDPRPTAASREAINLADAIDRCVDERIDGEAQGEEEVDAVVELFEDDASFRSKVRRLAKVLGI